MDDREFDDWCDYYDNRREEERIQAAVALDADTPLTRRQVWVLFGADREQYEQAKAAAANRWPEGARSAS